MSIKITLSDLGFMDLFKAFIAWTIVLLIVAIIINLLVGTQYATFIQEDPLKAARDFAEAFVTVVNPSAHPSTFTKIVGRYGISPILFFALSAVVNSILFTIFGLALLSGLRLWFGIHTIWKSPRSILGLIALAGASLSLIGPVLALIGLVLLLVTDVTPVVNQGMVLTLNSPFIYMALPFPWPITIGTFLWILGIGIIGGALLLILLIRNKDFLGSAFMAILIIGSVLSIIGMLLIGFMLMLIASGLVVLTKVGVAV
ncbi:hypothetical protein [Vulcanisaeta distributa]|uniref:hypothetical protein n=1 Tax=Vulcanisaeta distributa TaxID=164451 RepID=UPI0006CF66DD|nr:hypothetical protein [Vulcanisaeta distributa]